MREANARSAPSSARASADTAVAEVGGEGVDGHEGGGAGRDRRHEQEEPAPGGASLAPGQAQERAEGHAVVSDTRRAVGEPEDAPRPAGQLGVVRHQHERGARLPG